MTTSNSISVIIATKNRPRHISTCTDYLIKSATLPLEIIVVDQSTNLKTKKIILNHNSKLLKYFHLSSKGKSKALNFAILRTKGSLLAFTDDDCIPNKNWLKNIKNVFHEQKNIALCFGKTLPYQPHKHQTEICPCTFQKSPDEFSITKKPGKHWKRVGFGNNMVVRAEIFQKIGLFKEWLGPGSISLAAEDAEIINRSLINNYKIGYEPSMVVFHNKWLTPKKMIIQNKTYARGKMACYGFLSFYGFKFAKKICKNNMYSIKQILKLFASKENRNKREIFINHLIGFCIAFLAYKKNTLFTKPNILNFRTNLL